MITTATEERTAPIGANIYRLSAAVIGGCIRELEAELAKEGNGVSLVTCKLTDEVRIEQHDRALSISAASILAVYRVLQRAHAEDENLTISRQESGGCWFAAKLADRVAYGSTPWTALVALHEGGER